MILEYHKIDNPEGRWTRTPENFKGDLKRLWELGYRLVALTDYLDGKISLPAGTSPVILTFDDSSPGQFRYVQRGGDWVIDPECGLGILEAFAREHPGFGRAATFYVLPGANPHDDGRKEDRMQEPLIKDDGQDDARPFCGDRNSASQRVDR